jgi:hypothetical protein
LCFFDAKLSGNGLLFTENNSSHYPIYEIQNPKILSSAYVPLLPSNLPFPDDERLISIHCLRYQKTVLKFSLPLFFWSGKPDLMIPKILKKFLPNKHKTDDVHEATRSVIHHAELDNTNSTSATTGQTAHTNDHVPPNQHHTSRTMSWLKNVSWNAPKLLLELMNQASAFPPLQTVAALLLNLVNRYEVRYLALASDSRIYSSKLTSANKDSIQSVAMRIQHLNDGIVQHGIVSDPGELKRRERLNVSVSLMSCILLYLIFHQTVD